jgi:hypothetical protein
MSHHFGVSLPPNMPRPLPSTPIQNELPYLPAGMGAFTGLSDGDGAAGAMTPAGALFELSNDINSGTGLPDYSGKINYPLFLQ